jgi:hypothetical protein
MLLYFDVRPANLLLLLVIRRVDRISSFVVDFRFLCYEQLLACSVRSNEMLRWEYG